MKHYSYTLLVMILLTAIPVVVNGQDSENELMAIEAKKVIQNGEDNYRITFRMEYAEEIPEIERFAAIFLFDDSVSTSILDAANAYLSSFGGEEPDEMPTTFKEDNLFILQMKTSHEGKYQCYNIVRVMKDSNQGIVKSRVKQRNFIYDFTRKRILTVDDVFIPQRAERIKKLVEGTPVDMLMDDNTFIYTYKQNGKMLPELRFDLNKSPYLFTAEFLQLTGREKVDMPMTQNLGADGMADTRVFDVVESMPEFPGGPPALMEYLNENIRYPKVAEENGIQGRVICTFIVECDGSVTDVKVARSIDPSLDKEAVRVMKNMPDWIPGTQNDVPVRVKYTVPVIFKLQ